MNYRGGIPTGLTISDGLRSECEDLFREFDEFNDPDRLRAFAGTENLALVKKCILPSSVLNYDDLINKLVAWGRSPARPALFDLFEALIERYKDIKGKDCIKFIEKLKEEFAQAGSSSQEKDYEQLVDRNAPGDGHDTNRLAEQWIEEANDNPDELALRIALAVFSGTTFELIERAKNDLSELLQQILPSPTLSTQTPPVATHVPMMRRLEKAGARETEGKPPDWRRVVELDKPELAGEALVYIWRLNRETQWRQKLFDWLTKYAAGHAAAVRTRAAVAAGRLAIKDYRFIRDNLLNRWVKENDSEHRMAVGMALGVIAREEHLKAEVQNLLRRWSASDRLEERWAAIRAYIYVGPYCQPASEAVTRWREIAASESDIDYITFLDDGSPMIWEKPLFMSLMDAMARFFLHVAQQPEKERRLLYTGILEGLKKWVGDNERDAGLGLFMFFMIGQINLNSDGGEDTAGPPMLLQLVDHQPAQSEYRKQLAGLLEIMMSRGSSIIEAKELLCGWLSWADRLRGNSQLYEARIQTLFKDMIDADSSGRMRGRLAACLRDCGRNSIAQRLLSSL